MSILFTKRWTEQNRTCKPSADLTVLPTSLKLSVTCFLPSSPLTPLTHTHKGPPTNLVDTSVGIALIVGDPVCQLGRLWMMFLVICAPPILLRPSLPYLTSFVWWLEKWRAKYSKSRIWRYLQNNARAVSVQKWSRSWNAIHKDTDLLLELFKDHENEKRFN